MLGISEYQLPLSDNTELSMKVLHDEAKQEEGFTVAMQQTQADGVLGAISITHENIEAVILRLRDMKAYMDRGALLAATTRKNILIQAREAQLAYGQFDNFEFARDFTHMTFESESGYTKGIASVTADGFVEVSMTRSGEHTECYRVVLTSQQIHEAIILLHEGRIRDGKVIPLTEMA